MNEHRSNLVDLALQVIDETPKAIRVTDGTRKEWLPLSQIEIAPHSANIRIVTMPEWLAKEKGLI